jgi:hypothetical protein
MNEGLAHTRLVFSAHSISPLPVEKNRSKNEGPTHNVIENTGPCLGIASPRHDIFENKRFTLKCHDVTEK